MTVAGSRSVRVVRGWVRLYTAGLPDGVGDRRRLELESDIWEQLHDDRGRHVTRAVVGRWLRGIPADISWRYHELVAARRRGARAGDGDPVVGSSWWVVLTALVGVLRIVASVGAAVAAAGDGHLARSVFGGSMGVVAGGVVLAGLMVRRRDLVTGSWLVIAGCLMAFDPLFVPLSAVVIIGGLWTTDLQVTKPDASQPRALVVSHRRDSLTRRWYLWLAAAVVLFGIGLLFPLLVFTESDTATADYPTGLAAVLDAALWMAWWGSWLAAMACAGIGTVLGMLRGVVRHRGQTA